MSRSINISLRKIAKVVSFDVFDTCLTRIYAQPETLFYFLAIEMLKAKDATKETISEIAKLRIQAERRARELSSQEDINLDSIYKHFHKLESWNIDSEKMMATEVQLELSSVRPIAKIKQEVLKLRQQGKKIIFISDMYLPTSIIQQMLNEHGFAEKNDPIYVSGTIGLTKRSGNLFKYVLKKENIPARNLYHIGDNIRTDYISPRRLGVKAKLFTDSLLNRYEQAMVNSSTQELWISSQVAGISRAVRLSHSSKDNETLSDITANSIAPIIVSFVAWVLQSATSKDLKKLYFIARDGQIFLKVAKEIASNFRSVQLNYLYGSRQAWFLPSLFKFNKETLSFVMLPHQSKTVINCLKRLDIQPSEIEDVLSLYKFEKEDLKKEFSTDEIKQFWKVLLHPKVIKLIENKASAQRENVLAYFAQEGLINKSNNWAFVDIGWTLKTQAAVRRLLKSVSQEHIQGYYFGIYKEHLSLQEAGIYQGFLFYELLEKSNSQLNLAIFKNMNVIENIFTIADHGSVSGYKKEGERFIPCLRNIIDFPDRELYVKTIQETILRFSQEVNKTSLLENSKTLQEFINISFEPALLLLMRPTRLEAKALAKIAIGQDQNEFPIFNIARPLNFLSVIRLTILRIKLKLSKKFAKHLTSEHPIIWKEGSVVLSDPFVKAGFFIFTNLRKFFLKEHLKQWLKNMVQYFN